MWCILHEAACAENKDRGPCAFSHGTGTIGFVFLLVVLQENISEGLHSMTVFENSPYLCDLPMQKGAFLIPKQFLRE